MASEREQWASGAGFVLATIGSAVGLGNIWRFSYVAGESGGGSFLVIYLAAVVLVGLPIVIGEMAIGRRGRGDAVAGFGNRGPDARWRYAGWIGIIGCFFILSFYSVIAGWAIKYFVGAATGALWQHAGDGYGGYFQRFIGNAGEPVGWQLAALGLTMFIVAGGVRKGIEAANRILMPLLALTVVGLAVYVATLPGAADGWRFLFVPDWSKLAEGRVYVAAIGQAFFSLGIGMAVFITYSAYMDEKTRIPRSAVAIAAGDTMFAVVAGLAIFPAVFAFGMSPAAGPELAFITLPHICLKMPGGIFIGILFFGLLVAAAVTSMVSLLEVPVASVVHRTRLGRRAAVALLSTGVFVVGIPSALSFGTLADVTIAGLGILDAIDRVVSSYLLPFGGLLVCLYAGWHWREREALDATGLAGSGFAGRMWRILIRYVAPAMILLILLDTAGTF